jgi:hypothetical protein
MQAERFLRESLGFPVSAPTYFVILGKSRPIRANYFGLCCDYCRKRRMLKPPLCSQFA